jgi:cell division septation protein DedD
MRGVFDDGEIEPFERRRDTELTLGPAMLLVIFFGLALVCGLCFGLGYAVGHHGSQESSAGSLQASASAQTAPQPDVARPKPSATQQANPAGPASSDQPASPALETVAIAGSQTSNPPAAASSSPSQPQVRSALPAQANPPSQPTAALKAESPSSAAAAPMVQIAAVSHAEDAEVLVNALRKRGFAVVARRDAADGLIHVRIGPFANRNDANATRQKLLNDGYNAIVQP